MAKLKVVGPAIYSSSYARWFVEAMFEKEVDRYPAVFTRLITTLSYRNDYDLKSFYTCVGVLFGYGLIMRVFAFLFLRLLNRGQQQ